MISLCPEGVLCVRAGEPRNPTLLDKPIPYDDRGQAFVVEMWYLTGERR